MVTTVTLQLSHTACSHFTSKKERHRAIQWLVTGQKEHVRRSTNKRCWLSSPSSVPHNDGSIIYPEQRYSWNELYQLS